MSQSWKDFNFKVVCLYPELDPYCLGHLEKDKIYMVTESHYGGIDNKGQYRINGWWFSSSCFIKIDEYRNKRLALIDL